MYLSNFATKSLQFLLTYTLILCLLSSDTLCTRFIVCLSFARASYLWILSSLLQYDASRWPKVKIYVLVFSGYLRSSPCYNTLTMTGRKMPFIRLVRRHTQYLRVTQISYLNFSEKYFCFLYKIKTMHASFFSFARI